MTKAIEAPRWREPSLSNNHTPGELRDFGPEDMVEGVQFSSASADQNYDDGAGSLRGAHLVSCSFERVDLGAVDLGQVTMVDCRIEDSNAIELQAVDSRWDRVLLTNFRLGFGDFSGGSLEQVHFVGGKIDHLNLRYAKVRDLVLDSVKCGTLDLTHAGCSRVQFKNCDIAELTIHGATLTNFDMRGSTISKVVGIDALAGSIIDEHQLMSLAPTFAAELGITVA